MRATPPTPPLDDKFAQYLALGPALKDALVVFVKVRHTRVEAMIDHLKKAIEKAGVPHGYPPRVSSGKRYSEMVQSD